MKTFTISFSPLAVSNQAIVSYLDSTNEILNWRYEIPGMVFVVAERNTTELVYVLERGFPGLLYMITEFETEKSNGKLSLASWNFLNSPQPARPTRGLLRGFGALDSLPAPSDDKT